ncbi:hypothetical protein [Serratia ureilytica]|nr:hypothetical protein [Serratia ureilytica]
MLDPLHNGDVVDAFAVGAAAQNVTQYAIEQTHDIPLSAAAARAAQPD